MKLTNTFSLAMALTLSINAFSSEQALEAQTTGTFSEQVSSSQNNGNSPQNSASSDSGEIETSSPTIPKIDVEKKIWSKNTHLHNYKERLRENIKNIYKEILVCHTSFSENESIALGSSIQGEIIMESYENQESLGLKRFRGDNGSLKDSQNRFRVLIGQRHADGSYSNHSNNEEHKAYTSFNNEFGISTSTEIIQTNSENIIGVGFNMFSGFEFLVRKLPNTKEALKNRFIRARSHSNQVGNYSFKTSFKLLKKVLEDNNRIDGKYEAFILLDELTNETFEIEALIFPDGTVVSNFERSSSAGLVKNASNINLYSISILVLSAFRNDLTYDEKCDLPTYNQSIVTACYKNRHLTVGTKTCLQKR